MASFTSLLANLQRSALAHSSRVRNRKAPASWLALPLLIGFLTGCYSSATLHTARPVAPGERQFGAAVGGFLADEDAETEFLPTIETQARRGLSERADAGIHVTNLGVLGLDLNYALLLTDEQAVSIDPTIEFSLGTYAWIPVLWDFYSTDSMTLTASARAGRYWLGDLKDEPLLPDAIQQDAWLYGVGLGGMFKLTDTMDLAPEIRVIWSDRDEIVGREPIISLSLGLVY